MDAPATGRDPLWRDEFAIDAAHERYVSRRQFGKFLGLTSLAMFAGQISDRGQDVVAPDPVRSVLTVARVADVPVGGVLLFTYPGPERPVHPRAARGGRFVAYSQKCTHLSCAVYYAREHRRLECPCHEGFFSVDDRPGPPGPPARPLPRVVLERRGDDLVATSVDLQSEGAS